eukprot:1664636-Alexandrium_andersonii.AAC.1
MSSSWSCGPSVLHDCEWLCGGRTDAEDLSKASQYKRSSLRLQLVAWRVLVGKVQGCKALGACKACWFRRGR